jgi:hypothetical protein
VPLGAITTSTGACVLDVRPAIAVQSVTRSSSGDLDRRLHLHERRDPRRRRGAGHELDDPHEAAVLAREQVAPRDLP